LEDAQTGRGSASFERLLFERLDATLGEYVSASQEALAAPARYPKARDGEPTS
jgi:hypothetical protein